MTLSFSPLRAAALAAACSLVTVLGSGCSEEVAPALSDGAAFTLWGQLDPTASRQRLRISPITPTLNDEPETLDARVTLVDLETGAETVWRDSLVTFADGSRGHVFVADVQPAYGAPVEVRVTRADGTQTTARVEIPDGVSPYFASPTSAGLNVLDFVLPGAPRIVNGRVLYAVSTDRGDYEEAIPIGAGLQSVEFGWRMRVDFSQHSQELKRREAIRDEGRYTVRGVRFAGAVANVEWAPPYPLAFSRELLIQPGTVSNVRNGYGFVGAAFPFDVVWTTDRQVLLQAGL